MNSESKSGNSLCDARFPARDDLPPACDNLPSGCDARPATCDGLPSGCDAPFSTCDGPPAAGDAFLPGCDGLPTTCDGLKPVCAVTYASRETGHFPARPVLEVSGGSLTFRQSTKAGSNLMPKTGLGGPSPMPLKATMR